MEELEKKIEEQACKISGLKPGFDMEEEQYYNADRVRVYEAFIAGAKSPEAKAFHTQGMYTEEDMKKAFNAGQERVSVVDDEKYGLCPEPTMSFEQWFEQNKKK